MDTSFESIPINDFETFKHLKHTVLLVERTLRLKFYFEN